MTAKPDAQAPDLVQRLRDKLAWFDLTGEMHALLTEAADALSQAAEESDELHRLNCRLSELLTGSVNALRGDPPPLTLWSWHDLPERICAAMNMLAILTRANEFLAASQAAQAEPVAWRRRYLKPTGEWTYSDVFTPQNPELGPQEDQPLYAAPSPAQAEPPSGRDALRELETIEQAFREMEHAYWEPNWFTDGKNGARRQFAMWHQKGVAAATTARAALSADPQAEQPGESC